MFTTQQLVDWSNALTGMSLEIPFTAGPRVAEFGATSRADNIGVITPIPGGGGSVREGAFRQVMVQVILRARESDRDDLEKTAQQYQDAIEAVSNQDAWGTYVTFAQLFGTHDVTAADEEQRVTIVSNYLIEMGR